MTSEHEFWEPMAQQRGFRKLLDAFAHPGEVTDLLPGPSAPAWLRALAMLCDREVSLADPGGLLGAAERRFLQAAAADANQARFVLLDGRAPVPDDFVPCLGSLDSPELGATVVVVCDRIGAGPVRLSVAGPGVPGRRLLDLSGLHRTWLERRAAWVARFPVGVDLLLAGVGRVVALPRTSLVVTETA